MVNCGDCGSVRSYCSIAHRDMDFATKIFVDRWVRNAAMAAASAFYFWYSIRSTRQTKNQKAKNGKSQIGRCFALVLMTRAIQASRGSRDERTHVKYSKWFLPLFYSIYSLRHHATHSHKSHAFIDYTSLRRLWNCFACRRMSIAVIKIELSQYERGRWAVGTFMRNTHAICIRLSPRFRFSTRK